MQAAISSAWLSRYRGRRITHHDDGAGDLVTRRGDDNANPTSVLADALGRNLAETYRRIYGDQEPQFAAGLDEAARLVIDASPTAMRSTRDCEHTALVTLCVQDILRGRRLERTVTPLDWGHTILAALNHDIGMCAICRGDTAEQS